MIMEPMNRGLPLPTLLSHALVAFTIEFDNEAERQICHRTTRHGSTAGSLHAAWLVSMAMWSNCMQFVGEEGIPIRELERRARTNTNLAGMQRWGYITVEPDPADRRPNPPRSAWVVRATPAGRKAQEVWRPLFDVIEECWQTRFGQEAIRNLRASLERLVGEPTAQRSPLFEGLEPYPGGWRAAIPRPETLPHFPMILHRGGYPDGS
jgi:hypothetical protein